ncbi:MAG: hypothetical protein AB7U98_14005 [Candidatus Nitrosocosmicus sp.]|jgi:hypothetical protein
MKVYKSNGPGGFRCIFTTKKELVYYANGSNKHLQSFEEMQRRERDLNLCFINDGLFTMMNEFIFKLY